VERRAKDLGYRTLRLETGTRQPAAIRLYESLGYTPIACFPPYEDDPFSRCYAKRIG
jgi:putative acetyltransferase